MIFFKSFFKQVLNLLLFLQGYLFLIQFIYLNDGFLFIFHLYDVPLFIMSSTKQHGEQKRTLMSNET